MDISGLWGRLGRWITAGWRTLTSLVDVLAAWVGFGATADRHTRVTFRALTDAVIPETPELGDALGPAHTPGGLAIDLDDFLITYIDNGFQLGLPTLGPNENIPLADPIAHALDLAALSLVDRGGNESEPRADRPATLASTDDATPGEVMDAAGMFAKLSRQDRLRAINILDEFELTIMTGPEDLFEFDAGLVGQLVVGFTELIYYSEWQGYADFTNPPSAREHANDPLAVQSWQQTGYPGVANGYAALRGYLSTDNSPLGGGDPWATIDPDVPVRITRDAGTFRENDYDTSSYEEPYPE